MAIRAFLWPARILVAALVAGAVVILIMVADGFGAAVMLVVLGGVAVWVVYRPGVTLSDEFFVYRPFFWRRRKIGWDHINGFSVISRPGRAGSTIKVIAANISGEDLCMWALTFHSESWTDDLCQTLNQEASKRRRRRNTR